MDDFSHLNTSRLCEYYKSINPAARAIAYNSDAHQTKRREPHYVREKQSQKKAHASQNAWRYVLNIHSSRLGQHRYFFYRAPEQLFINYEQKKCGAQPQRAAGGWWWGVINYGRLTSSINQLPPSVDQSCFFYERDLYNSKERKVLRALLDIWNAATARAISNNRA